MGVTTCSTTATICAATASAWRGETQPVANEPTLDRLQRQFRDHPSVDTKHTQIGRGRDRPGNHVERGVIGRLADVARRRDGIAIRMRVVEADDLNPCKAGL